MEVHRACYPDGWFKPKKGGGYWPDFPVILIFLITTFLLTSCTFAKPQQTIALNLAAQNSGFLLAQEKPELAQEILEYSKQFLDLGPPEDFTKFAFDHWAKWVIEGFALSPFLEMNFKEMIKLVNIEITLSEGDKERVNLIYQVIRHFVIGIEAGK